MPALRLRAPALAVAVAALACAPEGDDMASATESTTAATTGGQTSTTAAASATTDGETDDGETSGGDTSGAVVDVDGVLLSAAGHHHECIDGCEGFYASDSLWLTVESAQARDVEIAWHDWSTQGRDLVVSDAPFEVDAVSLVAGEPASIAARLDYTGHCSFEEWSVPMTLLVTVDGVAVELVGASTAGYGWDC